MSRVCRQKLARLQQLAEVPKQWTEQLAQVKRMRAWVLEAEHILDGSPGHGRDHHYE